MKDSAQQNQSLFKVRTVTAFVHLTTRDFALDATPPAALTEATALLRKVQVALEGSKQCEVQTLRIATNPFGRWLRDRQQLHQLDRWLADLEISFCALGPAVSVKEVNEWVQTILTCSERFSCCVDLPPNDTNFAFACATVALQLGDRNFGFCVAAEAMNRHIPFFPVASASCESLQFAIGLENGALVSSLLKKCPTINEIPTVFLEEYSRAIDVVHKVCHDHFAEWYVGIDTSLNPSLEDSVAAAMEQVLMGGAGTFGGPGTIAVAAALTQAIQSVPYSIGYSGLMLPVCEDTRLAELSNQQKLTVSNVLSISHVCGVGVDTVPIACIDPAAISNLYLDVVAMAHRWKKPLSCRVFPMAEATVMTEFASPYLVNAKAMSLS